LALTSFGASDSTRVVPSRGFDQEDIEGYKNDRAFSYIQENELVHWLDGFKEWLANILADWFKDNDSAQIGKWIEIVAKVIMWALIAFAVGMLGYSLYKHGVFGVVGRKKQDIDNYYSDLEDKVLETDWQELINKAIGTRQYNVAIRLLFLQLLQSLNSAKVIEWDKSKSIRDYQRELATRYAHDFSSLAKFYQYSWFGDRVIDEPHFDEMYAEFKAFNFDEDVE
jgi:hypothetical protein